MCEGNGINMATTSQVSRDVVFRSALDQFKAGCGKAKQGEFQFTSFTDLKNEIAELQKKQASEKKLMNLARLSKFLEAMGQFGEVVEVFLNSSRFMPFIWGPIKFLLLIASTHADAFNTLLDAYEQIGETIPLLKQYWSILRESESMQLLLERIYVEMLDFHQKAVKHFERNVWRQIFHATWKTFNTEFGRLLKNLQDHKHLVEVQANIEMFKQLQQHCILAKEECQSRHEAEMIRRRREVETWLGAHIAQIDQDAFAEVRSRNRAAGNWLLELQEVRLWLNDSHNTTCHLWIKGLPGAGKTILASKIIERLQEDPEISVAFFYCNGTVPERNTFLAIARAFCHQLLQKEFSNGEEGMYSYLFEESSTSGEQPNLKRESLAKKVLLTMLSSAKRPYVVIDGLDECSPKEKRSIVDFFRMAAKNAEEEGNDLLHCLYVSQDDTTMRKQMREFPFVKIQREHSQEDIKHYVSERCRQLRLQCAERSRQLPMQSEELSASEAKSLAAFITERAEGLFIYARVVMDSLLGQLSKSSIKEAVKPQNLPSDLPQAYAKIMRQVLEQHSDRTVRKQISMLLGWIASAVRPLRWHEIRCAFAVDVERHAVDFSERNLWRSAHEIFGSLVEENSGDGTVQLAHSTVKVFLTNSAIVNAHLLRDGKILDTEFLTDGKIVDTESVNLKLGQLLLQYLCFPTFDLDQHGVEDDDENDENDCGDGLDFDTRFLKGHFALMDYAVTAWLPHLEHALTAKENSNRPLEEVAQALDDFLGKYRAQGVVVNSKVDPLSKAWRPFSSLCPDPFFSELTLAVSAMKKHLKEEGQGENFDRVLTIRKMISRITARLEEAANSHADIQHLYGCNLYKCPRISCRFFSIGFATQALRDEHVEKHVHPWICTFENCHASFYGFVSEKELKKHAIKEHNLDPLDENQFQSFQSSSHNPRSSSNSSTSQASHPSRHKCEDCERTFARKQILRDHQNAAHKDERPFKCSECPKAFARENDLKRHQRVHSGDSQIRCEIIFEDGGEEKRYGCGRLFSRMDSLNEHRKSGRGQRCYAPYLEYLERKAERDKAAEEADQEVTQQEPDRVFTPVNSYSWASDVTLVNPDAFAMSLPPTSFGIPETPFSPWSEFDGMNGIELPPFQPRSIYSGDLPSLDSIGEQFWNQ